MKDNCSQNEIKTSEQSQSCEGGVPLDPNKFGGYGFAINTEGWDTKREPTHNCHDQHKSGLIPTNLENDKAARLRQTVKDESGKVHQIGEIDFMDGNGFHKVMDIFDSSPNPWMVDRTFTRQSHIFGLEIMALVILQSGM